MGVTTTQTNKPFNPRGNDQSPKGFNRAKLYSGKALDFDGVNDKITGTASVLPTGANAFSTCFYVNKDADTNGEMVFWGTRSVNQANGVMLTTGKKVLHTFFGSDLTGNVDIEISKWYFVAVTFDGTTRSIYINGQLDASDTPSSVNVTGTSYQLGYGGAYYHNGELANAKVFNVALTAAQVADLYNNPEKVVPTGVANTALKLWLPMQEGAGTTAYDGSGNGNHGTISGATWAHGIGAPVAQTAVISWNKGTNLFNHSEEFSNWTNTENTTLVDNAATSPQGVQNAYSVTAGTNNNYHRIFNSITTTSGTSYTTSIFAKANGHNFILFRLQSIGGGNKNVSFNLSTGAVDFESTAVSDANIEPYGNGWYRCSITFTADVTSMSIYVRSQPATQVGVNDGINQYTGNGSSGIYIFGAQTAAGSLSPYVPTLATAQTSPVLLPQGLTTGRDITGVNLFENVRKQGALNLDGKSWAEVHDNASVDLTDAITLEAWVYWDTAQAGIMGRWGATTPTRNYMLYVENATKVRFYINASYSEYTSMTTGWHHIVGTYDKTNMRLFVDGTQVAASAQTAAITTSSEVLEIGRYRYGTDLNKEYNNPIAQPRIYNRALTAEEVQRNYNAGKNTYTN